VPAVTTYRMALAHRPERDGTVTPSTHVPFFLALEVMAQAWGRLLADELGDVLTPMDLGVVNVQSDFRRELFTGEADYDVTLAKLGTSSLTFAFTITQAGEVAASGQTTLARTDSGRVRSLPLTAEQRTALGALLHG
jgi:acyl-CoA thioesterase FadM